MSIFSADAVHRRSQVNDQDHIPGASAQINRLEEIVKGIGTGLLTGLAAIGTIVPVVGLVATAINPALPLLEPLALIGSWEVTKKLAKRCQEHFNKLKNNTTPPVDTNRPNIAQKNWQRWAWGAGGALATAGAISLYAASVVFCGVGLISMGIPGASPWLGVSVLTFQLFAGMGIARVGTIALYELSKKLFENARA